MFKRFSLVLFGLLPVWLAARPFIVMVYNVENLHDADGVAVYADYQPELYGKAQALTKVQNIATIVAKVGADHGPDIILFQEIEIDHTPGKTPPDYPAILKKYADTTIERMLGAEFTPEVADLPAEALLLKAFVDRGLTGYTVVAGADDSDRPARVEAGETPRVDASHERAIKCVVFTRFPVLEVRNHPTLSARNILEVKLDVDGYPLTVFDNHWKAGAGDPKTEPLRIQNAGVLRARLDELLKADPNADILIGGDLNSNYNQKRRTRTLKLTAINDVLGSQGSELAVRGTSQALYNLWFDLPPAERGSDVYKGEWGTLMNLIVARGLYDLRGVQYVDHSFAVARFPGLNADAAGQPVRWSREGAAGRGFSDHFPIYARFTTVDDNLPGKFRPLTREAGRDEADTPAVSKVDMAKTDFANAIALADLPPDAALRDGSRTGKLFRVEAAALEGALLKIEVDGETYDVFGPRKEIRQALYAQRAHDGRLKFYGELGTYKGNWQFLVKSLEWVK